MRIITRYILKEFFLPLVYCLTGFIAIYVLFELFGSFSRLLESDLSAGQILLYFAGYLAPYFHYLVPAALMLATLYTMWNFCRHSELTAMRASGLSFLTIAKPVLSVALVMALLVIYVNEFFMPNYAQWAKRLRTAKFDLKKVEQASDVVFENSRDNRTWIADEMVDDDCREMKDVKIVCTRSDGTREKVIEAETAQYLDGEWWFGNFHVTHFDAKGQETATPTRELDELTLRLFPELNERAGDILMQNRDWPYASTRQKLRFLRKNVDFSDEAKRNGKYDAWAQIAAPWACILITLLAIPAGIVSGRQSVFRGILGALGLYFLYYGVVIACMVFSRQGWLPPIPAAILPMVVFWVIGVRSFRRLH